MDPGKGVLTCVIKRLCCIIPLTTAQEWHMKNETHHIDEILEVVLKGSYTVHQVPST